MRVAWGMTSEMIVELKIPLGKAGGESSLGGRMRWMVRMDGPDGDSV